MAALKTDLSDLLAAVETSRASAHPDLSAELVRRVVEIEHEAGEDDAKALKALRQLVDDAVKLETEGR